ncbi:MAG: hypothetical protein ACK6BG_08530 [Cyanobacteriota bacterium]
MSGAPPRRLGCLDGTAQVEADVKRDFKAEINTMFAINAVFRPKRT